jgi:hypothetical protein
VLSSIELVSRLWVFQDANLLIALLEKISIVLQWYEVCSKKLWSKSKKKPIRISMEIHCNLAQKVTALWKHQNMIHKHIQCLTHLLRNWICIIMGFWLPEKLWQACKAASTAVHPVRFWERMGTNPLRKYYSDWIDSKFVCKNKLFTMHIYTYENLLRWLLKWLHFLFT